MMDELTVIEVIPRRVLLLSIVVFWLGIYVNKKINFLQEYNIPAPVTGGLLCSLTIFLLNIFANIQINFDLQLRDMLLLIFFSTIGLSANLRLLIEGGKALAVLLVLATIYLFIQNTIGIAVAFAFESHPGYGLLGGSVSFAGGHGTGITYGELFAEQYGLYGTVEVAMAFATFGLILGGLVGGPVAKFLINQNHLTGNITGAASTPHPQHESQNSVVNMNSMINATFIITVCIGAGELFHGWITQSFSQWFNRDIVLPLYLPALFAGIIIRNIAEGFKVNISEHYINSVGLWSDISLTLFLSMSLMSMQLLILADAMRPLIIVLLFQTVVMVMFACVIVFRVMGRDYDAAVIASGFAGLGLGATPVGLANMRAITAKFGASNKAFLIIPLLGAFFIDITNAMVIQLFVGSPLLH